MPQNNDLMSNDLLKSQRERQAPGVAAMRAELDEWEAEDSSPQVTPPTSLPQKPQAPTSSYTLGDVAKDTLSIPIGAARDTAQAATDLCSSS